MKCIVSVYGECLWGVKVSSVYKRRAANLDIANVATATAAKQVAAGRLHFAHGSS